MVCFFLFLISLTTPKCTIFVIFYSIAVMANLLFIDTAYSHTHVAIGTERGIMESIIHNAPNEQAMMLNQLISQVLDSQKMTLSDIDAVALDAGPGSYTGLRVGMGVAKGLCFALDRPLILFNKLELLATDLSEVAVILKARSGEGFVFLRENGQTKMHAQHVFYETFDWECIKDISLFTDDDTVLQRVNGAISIETQVLDVEFWNKVAQNHFLNQEYCDLAYAEPFYLKSAFTTKSTKNLI